MLSEIRKILENPYSSLSLGLVKNVRNSEADQAISTVELFPDQREVVCYISTGQNGFWNLPDVGDLVLVVFTEEEREALVLGYFSSMNYPKPDKAFQGNLVVQSRSEKNIEMVGKKTNIASAFKDVDGNDIVVENSAVKFNELKTLLESILGKVSALQTTFNRHSHTSNGVRPTQQSSQSFSTDEGNIDTIRSAVLGLEK